MEECHGQFKIGGGKKKRSAPRLEGKRKKEEEVPLNPFGIQFMSKDRLDCVLHKSFCKQITFDATKNTFLVLHVAQALV